MFEKFEMPVYKCKTGNLTREELETRRGEIWDLRKAGKTLQAIGDIYNLTRERVRQILNHK
jgi:DNA-directed RNA polymerase sigma subunit (sigma70/sigma32)